MHTRQLSRWNAPMARRWTCWFILIVLLAMTPTPGLGQATPKEQVPPNESARRRSLEMTRRVDELLDRHLSEIGWEAAPASEDAAFLRRIYLDLSGEPPSGREALDFIASTDLDKRSAAIDQILNSPNHASHFSDIWSGWLLPDEETGNPFFRRDQGLQTWLRERFEENLRYDRLVSDLLVATGPSDSGPAGFFVAHEGEPKKIAAKTARVFMGVQLDCAECHDHPFDNWTQQDFWGYAAYFAQISTDSGQAMQLTGTVRDIGEGDVRLPDTEDIVSPKPLVETGFSGLSAGTRRQQLTLWLTARENPYMARATVNRVWAVLFGQGLIEPVDDMRSIDMASHPEILGELSEYFSATGYDLRDLVGTLAKTKAYQRATQHSAGPPPPLSYAVMATKPQTQLQLAASIANSARQVGGDRGAGLKAQLRRQLGKLRGDASEAKLGIVSALVTLNGQSVDMVSREETSRLLQALKAPYMTNAKRVRWLFLATLSRPPTEAEEAAFLASVPPDNEGPADESTDESNPNAANAWQSDLLWALMNSSEFAMTP